MIFTRSPLLLSADTISSGKLDDVVFFELEHIDGDDYFNTNDLVRVNEDGSMTCIGRSNQFFINNAGVRFDAGLVQTAITAQPGIVACGLAPEFHKTLHDNIPVLYVETDKHGANDLAVIYQALIQAFVKDDEINVDTFIKNTAKALGADVSVKEFVRLEKGEGLEKREDNFAAEVAGMVK